MLKLKNPPTELQIECIVRMPNDAADMLLIEFVAHEMRERLKTQRDKGYHGWHTSICDNKDLIKRLKKNLEKGDLLDVLNLAAMALAREHLFGDTA